MGFKEVMALRQEGNLSDALTLAQNDYKENQDQWSASALFWVLKDLTTQYISEGQTDKANKLLKTMDEVVGHMGATTKVALETLASLRKEVIPYFSEISALAEESKKVKNRIRIEEIYLTAKAWMSEKKVFAQEVLHDAYAEIILHYLEHYYKFIPVDELNEVLAHYLSLHNQRPSKLHSTILSIIIDAKKLYGPHIDFVTILTKWGVPNLQQEDWKKGKKAAGESSLSLAEEALFLATSELSVREPESEVPESILNLLTEALNNLPDDDLVQLSRARIMVLNGEKDKAILSYEQLLQGIEEPMAWAEYAFLVEDPEIRLGAIAKALREESNDYHEYVSKARMELARLLIDKGEYDLALRELSIVAQVCLEKSYDRPTDHTELMNQIPEGTEQNKDNKELYYPLSRPALAHIYREIPEVLMMVYDVMAMRLREPAKQVVPMLKLMTPEGKTALVTPKEAGILPGDNRGNMYMVKLWERYRKHIKVVLLTECNEINPKEAFPTKVGVINGYSEALHAYHVMDNDSRHHYLPGKPNEYIQGEFISFILLVEKQIRKGNPTPSVREFIHHTERVNPQEAILSFQPLKARVEGLRGDNYLLQTEQGTYSYVNKSIAPVELSEGDTVIVRGFQQRRKDNTTRQVSYHFVTLSIEPYFEI